MTTNTTGEQVYERLMRAAWWACLAALLLGIGALLLQVPAFTLLGGLMIAAGILGWLVLACVRLVRRIARVRTSTSE